MAETRSPGAADNLKQISTSGGEESGIEDTEYGEDIAEITEPFDPTAIDIKTKGTTVDLLLSRIAHGELDLMPDFQRKAGIWDSGRRSRLIESILLRIPLPVIYVAADQDEHWLVVDGLQRLFTLDTFINKELYGLQDLEFLSQYEGTFFSGLPRQMQRRVRETELVVHIIQPGTPKDVTRTIFKRINTGGLILSGQEIRHALYQGPATRLLITLAESEPFRRATNFSIKDDRMQDRELALRFLAFHIFTPEDYRTNDLDAFLSHTMEYLNQCSEEIRDTLSATYQRSMEASSLIFGDQAFRKQYSGYNRRNPINKALFEIWTVGFAQLDDKDLQALESKKQLVVEKFIQMLSGTYVPKNVDQLGISFHDSISRQTSGTREVAARFQFVAGLIQDVLLEESDVEKASGG